MIRFKNRKYPEVPNVPKYADKQTRDSIQNLWYSICDLGHLIEKTEYVDENTIRFHMPRVNCYVESKGTAHIIHLWYVENNWQVKQTKNN